MKNRFYKIVRQPVGQLRQDLPEHTRVLVFFLEPFSEEFQVCWPQNDVPNLSQVSAKVISTCAKRQRTVAIHDAKVDPLTVSLGDADFSSALAVPLLDSSNNVVGLIYSDNAEIGVFSKQHKLVMERIARSVTPKLPIWSPALAKEQANQGKQAPALDLRVLAWAGGLLLFFGVSWIFSLVIKSEPPAPAVVSTPVVDERPPATRSMASFANLLRIRQFNQAYRVLHPDLQARVSEEEFLAQAYAWFGDEANAWSYNHRTISAESIEEQQASFYVRPSEEFGEGEQVWTWRMVLLESQPESGGGAEGESVKEWRLTEFRGGPFAKLFEH